MSEITVSGLRNQLVIDLDFAQQEVAILKERLKWIENVIAESPEDSSSPTEEDKPTVTLFSRSSETPGTLTATGTIKGLMLNAPARFSVVSIAKDAQKDFPDLTQEDLKRKCSQIAGRLKKSKRISLLRRGKGRKPNTYKSNESQQLK